MIQIQDRTTPPYELNFSFAGRSPQHEVQYPPDQIWARAMQGKTYVQSFRPIIAKPISGALLSNANLFLGSEADRWTFAQIVGGLIAHQTCHEVGLTLTTCQYCPNTSQRGDDFTLAMCRLLEPGWDNISTSETAQPPPNVIEAHVVNVETPQNLF